MKFGIVPLSVALVAGALLGLAVGRYTRTGSVAAPGLAVGGVDGVGLELGVGGIGSDSAGRRVSSGGSAGGGVASRSFADRVATALAHDSERRKAYEVERLFEGMAKGDAPGIMAEIMGIADHRERGGLLRPFFVKWGELDGPVAFEAAQSLVGRDRMSGLSAALAGWAHTDPYGAWAVAKPLIEENPSRNAGLSRGVLEELARRDLNFLLTAIDESPDSKAFSQATRAIVSAVVESGNPEALLNRIQQMDDEDFRADSISQLFQRWGEVDTEGPLDALGKIESAELASDAMAAFIKGWASSDPVGALGYSFDNLGDPSVEKALGSVLQQSLMYADEAESLALTERMVSMGILDKHVQSILGPMSFQNPELAFAITNKIVDKEVRMNQQSRVFSGWARRDFDAALEQYKGLPADENKSRILYSLTHPIIQSRTGGAKLMDVLGAAPSERDRTRTIEYLLQNVSRPDSGASQDLLEALKVVAESEPNLSARGVEARDKLFGAKP